MSLAANKKTARLAGLLYLLVVITGIFSLAYVPSKLIVRTDAAATFQNIAASETLFRMSLVSSAFCYLAFLLLPFALYFLLRSVNETAAKMMVVLAIVSVPISMLNLQNKYAVLTLINGAEHLKIVDQQQIYSQLMMLLKNYDHGILIVQIFWGLWLLPFGFLVYRSGFLPRILGVLLMLGCFGYLFSFVGNTMMPEYGATVIARFVRMPGSFGEIGTGLWLLIRGIHERPLPEVQAWMNK